MSVSRVHLSLFALILTSATFARAEESPACLDQAMESIRAADPRAYEDLRRSPEPKTFSAFLDCSEKDLQIASAIHEGVHGISNDDLPLANGERFPQMQDIKLEPREIVPMLNFSGLETFDNYKETYMLGDASAKELYFVLLDEFNAYSRELTTAVRLSRKGYTIAGGSLRDGVAAMMIFLKLTVAHAQRVHPDDWSRMQSPTHVRLIRALWRQAETALNEACLIEDMGIDDKPMLKIVYSDANSGALAQLLGTRPQAPRNCNLGR